MLRTMQPQPAEEEAAGGDGSKSLLLLLLLDGNDAAEAEEDEVSLIQYRFCFFVFVVLLRFGEFVVAFLS